MNVMVTGASGFIGGNLIKEIKKRNLDWDIHILAHTNSDLRYIDNLMYEKRIGDITDINSLNHAFKGMDVIYHCAAYFTLETGKAKELEHINVKGTKNVLEAAKKANVCKVVHTSTGATVGIPQKGDTADETTPFNKHKFANDYTLSKYKAENLAIEFAKKGLNVTVVNPVAPIGRGDVKPTPTGQFLIRYIKKQIWYYLDAITHFVHLNDVIDGHIKAFSKGRPGEKYLLGKENLSMHEIYKIMEDATGVSRRQIIKLPYFLALTVGYCIDGIKAASGYKTTLGSNVVKYARLTPRYDFSKAINELGMTQTPLADGFREAKEWFEQNGYL